MALNSSHSGSNGVVLFAGERIVHHQDGVEIEFEMKPMKDHFKGTKKGKVYLTTLRLIFHSAGNDLMQSFAMPFYYLKDFEIKQPIIGANYLKGRILAQPNGGWEGQANFQMHFKSGGAIDVGERLVRLATKAPKVAPPNPGQAVPQQNGYAPPPNAYGVPPMNGYAPPPQGGYAPMGYPPAGGYPPQAGAYPPTAGAYPPAQPYGYPPMNTAPYGGGYQYPPTGAYPQAAPYPTEQPPAYTTVVPGSTDPSAPPMNEKGQPTNNAYYNPANPQTVYVPQDQPPSAPPAYSEKDKNL
ncbi:uncharacterized protein [Antedon mediterranea]|uniref:uncharacterized protein n=1 Tax=Antedon mediterranea TaxID=105859 RepID=UPI003AF76A7F